MKKTVLLLVAAAILFSSSQAFAASPWAEKGEYKDQVLAKLDFGVKNTLGGWMELFQQPMKSHKDGKTVSEGALRGIYYAIADTFGGALHLVTFPLPQVDVELPENGVSFS